MGQRLDSGEEIRRPRRGDTDALAGSRVVKGQPTGMQHLAGRAEAGGLEELSILGQAIDRIARQGITEVLEVHADLVGASGVESGLDQGDASAFFQDAEGGPGLASGSLGDRHSLAMRGMTGDGGVDLALGDGQFTAEDGVVDFFDRAPGELLSQGQVRFVVFGSHQAAAGVFVQAVDDAGPGNAADAAEPAGAVMQKGVDEGVFRMARGRVHDQPGGFVDYDQVIILEEDGQGDGLRFGLGRLGFGPAHLDAVAGAGREG